jgi:hypothetical protein
MMRAFLVSAECEQVGSAPQVNPPTSWRTGMVVERMALDSLRRLD